MTQKNHVLVTGGAGYIGSHVCKALKNHGLEPVTFDNLTAGHKDAVKWGPFFQGDLLNKKDLKQVFSQYHPIAVFHFAALALVGESMQYPEKYYLNNVLGSLNLLETMKELSVPYLIFSSTCATYGNPKKLPLTEDHPQHPINPYGKSKLMIEQMLEDFPIHSVALRYFNAAGADLETEIGEAHANETHLIPLILQTALKKHPHVNIFGTDFPTKDGSAIRDYIHVEDLAKAHIKAFDYLLSHKKSEFFNLGTGNGFSVLEVLQTAEIVCQQKIPKIIAKRREGDPPILVANAKKATDMLKWTPHVSDLTTILSSAWKWHLSLDKKKRGFL